MEKLIIYTDLDGTFLNHHNYSFEESRESIELIKLRKIPLVFTTSKTRVEVELLRDKVAIQSPFIIENGAAVFFPQEHYSQLELPEISQYKVLQLGLEYAKILDFYRQHKEEYGLFGFSDMTVEEVAKHTGLNLKLASYAKTREFSEPFLLQDKQLLQQLVSLAKTYEIKITQGGRFFHLIGEKQDKGLAVEQANQVFRREFASIKTIGLGDSQNDLSLLAAVDVPIAIKRHDDTFLDYPKAKRSSWPGAKGWNETILQELL
ncbi:MAG: HAD-IIB family hydrolase [Spirochaetota bacterium]